MTRNQATKLHATIDAGVWAAEFMKVIERGATVDEALMNSWFANSIMTGYDHGERAARDPS